MALSFTVRLRNNNFNPLKGECPLLILECKIGTLEIKDFIEKLILIRENVFRLIKRDTKC